MCEDRVINLPLLDILESTPIMRLNLYLSLLSTMKLRKWNVHLVIVRRQQEVERIKLKRKHLFFDGIKLLEIFMRLYCFVTNIWLQFPQNEAWLILGIHSDLCPSHVPAQNKKGGKNPSVSVSLLQPQHNDISPLPLVTNPIPPLCLPLGQLNLPVIVFCHLPAIHNQHHAASSIVTRHVTAHHILLWIQLPRWSLSHHPSPKLRVGTQADCL